MRDLRDFKEVCLWQHPFRIWRPSRIPAGTVDSNIVTGELREVLTVVKTAVNKSYELGGRVTYVISLSNNGTVALTGRR